MADKSKECFYCKRFPGDDRICSYTLDVVNYKTIAKYCDFFTNKNKNMVRITAK